jgi:hypothetical protein
MRRVLAVLFLAAAMGAAARPASAAIEVAITKPEAGAHSLDGLVNVEVTASADAGIYAVQLNVDGKPYGDLVTTPVSAYRYVVPWNTNGLAFGTHTLTVTAMDWSQPFPAGAVRTTDPLSVDVGPAYPTIALSAPPSWTFVRGSVPVQASVTTALDPTSVRFTLDGNPLATATASPWSTSWNSAATSDGQHVLGATVTDGRGKTSSDSATVTVDNTPPSTYVITPAADAFATGSLTVQAHASDAYGIASVQFAIDGSNVGPAVTQADAGAPYTFSSALAIGGLSAGQHTLTVVATDAAGNKTSSAGVGFVVGFPPPSIVVSAPPTWTFARGVVPVTALVAGGTPPLTARLFVDGAATTQTATAAPFVFQWDTTMLKDGTHMIAASVVDAQGRSASSTQSYQTVDNTPPGGFTILPTANQRLAGPTTFRVQASDAYGIKSVQFLVDGAPVGAPVTATDAGQPYVYSTIVDTNLLAPGAHTVAAQLTDNAGNATTLAAVPIKTGPIEYLPVLNYHEINAPDGNTPWDQTPQEADQQLAWLKANGYQSVTLDQYRQWLAGANIGIAKPVLITVDDGLRSELAWDPLLQKYGFKAVMFVITGYADNKTPGSTDDPNNMSWADIQALAANGRWQIAFHAGQYGHGDYGDGVKIGTNGYQPSCPYFYSCLAGTGSGSAWTPQSAADYKLAVSAEINAGILKLKQQVPSANVAVWAAPFNDAGQWTNLYNDPSGQVQAWLPGYLASKFQIVFTQTNPVTYGQASGTVGDLAGFNRHYRFEVRTDTSITQFANALKDPAFAR